jgi:Domain of unknown function (DUF6487)
MPDPICPKCHGAMEQGFTLDHSYGESLAAEWVEGPPEKSFWHGVRTRGRERRAIETWRCEQCGYLESYAR